MQSYSSIYIAKQSRQSASTYSAQSRHGDYSSRTKPARMTNDPRPKAHPYATTMADSAINLATGDPVEPYLSYYSSRCKEFLSDGGRHLSVKTHANVIRVAKLILEGRRDRNEIGLPPPPKEPKQRDMGRRNLDHASTDLCAGLSAMQGFLPWRALAS
jgi:hypothetical protein